MSHHGFSMPSSGLASRRGGQNIAPLSMDALKSPSGQQDNGVPTPRTSRGHLLAALRTAPKTAAAATFPNNASASPAAGMAPQGRGARNMYDNNASMYHGPKTSLPRFSSNAQAQGYNPMMAYQQQYTTDQVLTPPDVAIDEQVQEQQIDPSIQAYYINANAYLAEQQRRLQAELLTLQAAAQQMNLNGQYQMMQQQQQQQQQQVYTPNVYQQQQQQQQVKNIQPLMATGISQPNIYAYTDPTTGQQMFYVDQNQAQQIQAAQQLNILTASQNQYTTGYGHLQQSAAGTPRVQVSPPPQETNKSGFRNPSPPRRFESPAMENPTPLPPPSANAFRRGHKKSLSLAQSLNKGALSVTTDEPPKSAGPKTTSFPATPLTATGSYGPGQARAGEHPCRQPRNPPSMDELKAKPTAKHEGSKNFVARTRRSAIHNISAGRERRKGARSPGTISPISELHEEPGTPVSDNDSVSVRSGSGSLVVDEDAECSLPSSRTSTGSWGAIGSDRPSSSQKVNRDSVDSNNSSDAEADKENNNSFASVFKKASRASRAEKVEGQRKAARSGETRDGS
ncbi:hypothetical protein DL546_008985 [Coniochaeta pulveracea]|uniref:Uncharacterized protein n=1 Tax=Coniochaeta pulveracea TaxID=177199 RepID=A0A420YNV3_9PEZI|nr:hypothetical protein DL546_008985 [Coniochaeta pulveracea]